MTIAHPRENLDELSLQKGEVIADFGAGPGHYTIAAAKEVGDSGQIYAIEIQKDLVSKVQSRAKQAGLANVDVIWGDLEESEGSTLDGKSADTVLCANVLFQIKDKRQFVQEVHRVLKSGGRVLAVDWTSDHGGLGPPTDRIVSESDTRELFTSAGFEFRDKVNAGEHHYGFIFSK